jgi:hypothetical protein
MAWVAAVSAVEAVGFIEEAADSTGVVADIFAVEAVGFIEEAEADSGEAGAEEAVADDSLQFCKYTRDRS